MSFNDVVGNERVKNIIRRALERSRIPNSLLFTGPEGIGKFDTAITFAKALNCLQKKGDSCDECAHCIAIDKNRFPDVLVIAPEKDITKIEQIRMLKKTAYLKPMAGKKRVFIIRDAEMMREEGANSLLKILEEPPLYSHIILISRNPYLILSTIKSRCQTLTFSPISQKKIQKELIKRGMDDQKASLISLMVKGNLNEAINFEYDDVQLIRQRAWKLFVALIKGEHVANVLSGFSSSGKGYREEIINIFNMLAGFLRDFLLIKSNGDSAFLLNPDYEENIIELAPQAGYKKVISLLFELESAFHALRKRANVNLVTTTLISNAFHG